MIFCRIKNNLKQVQPDWLNFNQDMRRIMAQFKPDSTQDALPLREALSSHATFATIMVDVLSLVFDVQTSKRTDTFAESLMIPVLSINMQLDLTGRVYHSALQLNRTTLIPLLARISNLNDYGSERNIVLGAAQMFRNVMGRFLVFESYLRTLEVNLHVATQLVAPVKGEDSISHEIRILALRVGAWKTLWNTRENHALDCGYPKVNAFHCILLSDLICGIVFKER